MTRRRSINSSVYIRVSMCMCVSVCVFACACSFVCMCVKECECVFGVCFSEVVYLCMHVSVSTYFSEFLHIQSLTKVLSLIHFVETTANNLTFN